MDFASYQLYFQSVINQSGHTIEPYTRPAYLEYTRLNWSRQQRWLKKGQLNSDLVALLKNANSAQHWVVITEPWCGDAPHILPYIYQLTQVNPLISLDIQLRDSEPFLINHYLSGQSKSIPKLIIRDAEYRDLLVWGPRPLQCQQLFDRLRAEQVDAEDQKLQLQWWYNEDKGVSFQQELFTGLRGILGTVTSATYPAPTKTNSDHPEAK